MKVYLVSRGDYSDYHVCGAYSTQENAERAKAIYSGGYSDACIETRDLDSFEDIPEGLLPYLVKMRRDGTVDEVARESADGRCGHDWAPYGDGESVAFYMLARDEEHAIKIANERRGQLIAMNEWTTDWDAWSRKRRAAVKP